MSSQTEECENEPTQNCRRRRHCNSSSDEDEEDDDDDDDESVSNIHSDGNSKNKSICSEQRESHEDLQRSLRNVMDHVSDVVSATSIESFLTFCNGDQLYGDDAHDADFQQSLKNVLAQITDVPTDSSSYISTDSNVTLNKVNNESDSIAAINLSDQLAHIDINTPTTPQPALALTNLMQHSRNSSSSNSSSTSNSDNNNMFELFESVRNI